jgi:hypothetical protein
LTSVQGCLSSHGTAVEYLIRFKWHREVVKGQVKQILESLLTLTFPCILRLPPGMCFTAYDGHNRVRVSSVRIEKDAS